MDTAYLKQYLRITWQNAELDAMLGDILERGKKIIKSYAGYDGIDFDDTQSEETQLLLDLCRYIYNDAYEEFEHNFSAEIISLRAKYAVAQMGEDDE